MTFAERIAAAVTRYAQTLEKKTGADHVVRPHGTSYFQIVRRSNATVVLRIGRGSGCAYDPKTGFPVGNIERM